MQADDWRQLQPPIETILSGSAYYPCLLIVHPAIGRLEDAAAALAAHVAWPIVSIGSELSLALLPVASRARPRTAARWVETRLAQVQPGPVLCRDIDLLMEPSLELDPLALLRSTSRTTRLAVLWPGGFENGILSYAAPAHSHYRAWNDPQAYVVRLA